MHTSGLAYACIYIYVYTYICMCIYIYKHVSLCSSANLFTQDAAHLRQAAFIF